MFRNLSYLVLKNIVVLHSQNIVIKVFQYVIFIWSIDQYEV